MATEILDILIRTRGGAEAANAIRGISSAAAGVNSAVALLTRTLAALGVAIGVREVVELSDSFTTLENRLRVTTDSAEELAAVQQRLFQIANDTRTPIETTATLYQRFRLATLSLGASQNDVLTAITAVNQAAKLSGATAIEANAALIQLSQGFNRGTLSGDEFRSVSEQLPVILDIVAKQMGKTRAEVVQLGLSSKLSAKLVFDALVGQADNINSQFGEVGVTFADIFTIVRNELLLTVGTIQNFFGKGDLTKSIADAASNIAESLINGFAAGIEGAAEFLSVGAEVVDLLENVGLSAENLTAGLQTAFFILETLFNGLRVGARIATTSFAALTTLALDFAASFGFVDEASVNESVGDFADQFEKLLATGKEANTEFSTGLADLSKTYTELSRSVGTDTTLSDGLRSAADSANAAAAGLRGALTAQKALADQANLDQGGTAAPVSRTREQESALKKLQSVLDSINKTEQKRLDPLRGQIEAIDTQIRKVKELQLFGQDEPLRLEAIRKLEAQRIELQQQLTAGQAEQSSLLTTIEGQLGKLTTLDRDRAAVLRQDLNEILTENVGVESLVPKLRDFLQGITDDINDLVPPAGEALGNILAEGARAGLRAALTGDESFDFIEFFSNQLADFTLDQMTAVFEQLSNTVEDLFSKASSSLFGDSGLGSGFGAALGLAGTLALNAFKGTESEVTNGLVKSAVTSSQEVRGIVAGPTSIPIFQLGEELENSMVETNSILREILGAIRGSALTPVAVAGISPPSLLGTTSATLA